MLTFIKETKQDLFESVKNGEVQEYAKEYILELLEDYGEEKISEATVLEYFDCEYRNESYDITYENLCDKHNTNADVVLLRDTILAVYKRCLKERDAK